MRAGIEKGLKANKKKVGYQNVQRDCFFLNMVNKILRKSFLLQKN